MPSLLTLPVELVYRILDNLDELTLLLSVRGVCTRLNLITDTYRRYQTLTTLDLGRKKISDKRARFLANALQTNTTLTTLDLGVNQIGGEGAQFLANALQTNTTLTTLDLRYNRIGDKGSRHILEIEKNLNIKCVIKRD